MDKKLKYYWCRTRVKGIKRLRNSECLEDTTEAQGSMGENPTMPELGNLSLSGLGIESGVAVETPATEACYP